VSALPRSALPHLVSFCRPLIGAFLLLGLHPRVETALPLVLVLAACASDWLDGELARRAGGGTLAGRLVDNLCDFALLLAVFGFLAQAAVWTPPVWGRLARHLDSANWLPVGALVASFGVYFARLCRDMAAGREPARSPRGHAAGVSNYMLAVAGAVEHLPGFTLGPWLLEPAMLSVVLLNLVAVPENVRLMFHPDPGGPRMRA
jgi:phosphatidylglycerophosphate synthase